VPARDRVRAVAIQKFARASRKKTPIDPGSDWRNVLCLDAAFQKQNFLGGIFIEAGVTAPLV